MVFRVDLLAAEAAARSLLSAIDPEPDREGLRDTPGRVARALAESLAGYAEDPGEILSRRFANDRGYDEMVVVGPVDFASTCEHHLLPFVGEAFLGYVPGERVVGLSKLARLVDCYARRLQIQERMTAEIAEAMALHLAPRGWAVAVRARHLCLCSRGAKKPRAEMTTTMLGGVIRDRPEARQEFLAYAR